MQGPAGYAWEVDVSAELVTSAVPKNAFTTALRGFWYVFLPKVHPVLEWYALYITQDAQGFELVVVIVDPETYLDVDTSFDWTTLRSCKPIEGAPELSLSLPSALDVSKATQIGRWFVSGMVAGQMIPDRFEISQWSQAKNYALSRL